MDDSEKRPRRQRYAGRNPRNFQDKYKEHQPQQYPDDIAKILDNGKTPAGMHRPIMVQEILKILALEPGNDVLDCTLGYGGHARELLTAVQPGGRLLGVDADPIEFPKTEARLRSLGTPDHSIVLQRLNFAGLAPFLARETVSGVDALLVDLGVSSMQFDDPSRGFSFKMDGPLDMRMNPERGIPVSDLLSTLSQPELSQILSDNGDEPNADRIATAILNSHAMSRLERTLALSKVVKARVSDLGAEECDRTVRRVFQSLRIAVNKEFQSLDSLLKQLPRFLKSGGRGVFLTFHSGEDRRVKSALKRGLQDGDYSFISRELIRPSTEEQRANPRSSSAKLRFAIRS